MTLRRAVPNIKSERPAETRDFFLELGFEVATDMGWVVTVASPANPSAQVTIVGNDDTSPRHLGGGGWRRCRARQGNGAGLEIVYPLRDEDWGVRRFMRREPSGTIVNVVSHPFWSTELYGSDGTWTRDLRRHRPVRESRRLTTIDA
jgi:hypothetical protein